MHAAPGATHGQTGFAGARRGAPPSFCSWWAEYSHRKNDEEDMVADSLLYDERCHLPRTAPGPR